MVSSPATRRSRRWAFANAVQVLVVAQKELSVADGEGGVGTAVVVLEDVVRQQLELWTGRHHVGPLELGHEVELAVGEDRGRPRAAHVRTKALLSGLARGCILKVQNASGLAGPVQ